MGKQKVASNDAMGKPKGGNDSTGKSKNGKKNDDEEEDTTPVSTPQWMLRHLLTFIIGIAKICTVLASAMWAYRIRLYSVKIFGYLVHGWDPTFNARAARYMQAKGMSAFFKWYDYMSWYPLGRPIGTTIYPGMQVFVVWVTEVMKNIPKMTVELPALILKYVPKSILYHTPGQGILEFGPMTLNQVVVMSGAWLSGVAVIFLALLTWEVSESSGAGVVAGFIFAGIPAHLMRSVAGQYDNEAVAMVCFCANFYFWCRSLRTPTSWPWAFLAAIAYFASAATWGGYIFVNNLIGLHAAVLVASGWYNSNVHRAYSVWYVFGTAAAMFVPVINTAPLRSLEQFPALAVFVGFQVLEGCDIYRRRQKKDMTPMKFFWFRVSVFLFIGFAALCVCYLMFMMNYFQPLSSRIRGLFLKHHKTGNPLVDSVSEHSAASSRAYESQLGFPRHIAALGLLFCWQQKTPARSFPVVFAMVAYHFSLKMSRLMIICGPIVSILAGYPIGIAADWCIEQFVQLCCGPWRPTYPTWPVRTGGMGSIIGTLSPGSAINPVLAEMRERKRSFKRSYPAFNGPLRMAIATVVLFNMAQFFRTPINDFIKFCDQNAQGLANPGIVHQARLNNGKTMIIDDELKGYEWFKKNTPKDSRVMSWWDYGYQITGLGMRTSLADGNTWNHEHIATLGRILSAKEEKSWNIQRHLADYVLVKAGSQETDLRISTHFARIGNSVFPDICGPQDPTCTKYGFERGGSPTKMMKESFVHAAVKHGKEGITVNPKLFKEVHTSQYGTIRIFQVLNISQESKDWVADPANKICDAPGSWYCVGQYPPALAGLIAKRKNFAQLEDFNSKNNEKSAYSKYLEQKVAKGDSGDHV